MSKPWDQNIHTGNMLAFYGSETPPLELGLSAILITISFQLWLTLGLHCAELLVNFSRDEELWRRATSSRGVRYAYGPVGSIKAAATSWKVLVLFALKALTHWPFGLSVSVRSGIMYMNWEGILSLCATLLFLACFTSLNALSRPKGPQPAIFGHLQTLANLIDVWSREDVNMWWGHNTLSIQNRGEEPVFHASTASTRLPPVQMGALYAG